MKIGLQECIKNELLHPYPVISEKKGEYVAQFKYTVAIRHEGPLIIAGNTIDLSHFVSEHKLVNEAAVKSLEVPLDTFLPNFKKTTKVVKKKKDNKEKKAKKKEAKLRKAEEAKKKKEEDSAAKK